MLATTTPHQPVSGAPQARRPLLKRMSLRARIGVGVAVDGAGNIYVTDSGNHRVLKLPAGGIG
jgi:DNA-binding beta-propeller fold protein YncE